MNPTIPPWEDELPSVTTASTPRSEEKRLDVQGAPLSSTPTTPSAAKVDIMDFFPLEEARKSQEIVLREIDSALSAGYKVIVLEAPVGSGKSAIATTLARFAGEAGAHVITPRKSLQDQYFEDFDSHMVLMKGRNSYPCTIDASPAAYKKVVAAIVNGKVVAPRREEPDCASAPCRDDSSILKDCNEARECPYFIAMRVAQGHPIVVHNLHSFIFQASFGGKFEKRKFLLIDEAHEIESTIRDFISKKIRLPIVIKEEEIEGLQSWAQWEAFLLQAKFVPKETERDVAMKAQNNRFRSEKEEYLLKVATMNLGDNLAKGFSVEFKLETRIGSNSPVATLLEFIPNSVGPAVQSMLLNFGEQCILMSGTIYSKETYCRNIGVDPESAYFIRVGSSFPKENRPIYCIPKYQVNTAHANWNDNFPEVVQKIKDIAKIFHDVKGLIHTPSYMVSEQLRNALNDPRFVTHQANDFQEKLGEFFEGKDSRIFLSPVCQQGVDFKGDRARFQIILRVPYLNTSSKFISDKLKNNFSWYNYQSLVIFGQQIGRVNRAADDYGVTFLLDERFNKFLSKNNKVLPGWVKEALVFKS